MNGRAKGVREGVVGGHGVLCDLTVKSVSDMANSGVAGIENLFVSAFGLKGEGFGHYR